ncbi:hypothetical protein W97_09048 [Coniosporium apollinis CBS 100218]|uniref:GATA-type domain-containing protein n=1 Tax=Coniosporium apollinis (strain CBS 100218) TaxID=1168221 RepID=R7Z6G4_CONA1|nr:uncharacterized protein W97_09048 [Coniosporium apollinis CBS 100218]EON69785.1 hypothetical protein W97_09048 [Coniosporium apollinis CBS 100218]
MASLADNNLQPICQNCTTSTTPLWRRDEVGSVLCNACGLFLKLHGRPRPISLKTDVIKSRNRVKTAGQGPRKKAPGESNGLSLAAAHPDASGHPSDALLNQRRASQKIERSNSPVSRTGTPGLNPNIAPQHIFDGVSLDGHGFHHSPSLPSFNLRQPSPSAASINGSHFEPPPTYDGIIALNTQLKTRVSELEVINDLFRGRVSELEQGEQEARRNEMLARECESSLRGELEAARNRESELKRRLEEMEADLAEYVGSEGSKAKRVRLSDLVDESGGSTPLSNPQS